MNFRLTAFGCGCVKWDGRGEVRNDVTANTFEELFLIKKGGDKWQVIFVIIIFIIIIIELSTSM